MKIPVAIPSPLLSYTGGAASVEVNASTLAQALEELDRRFPGIRFRIVDEQDRVRPHIRFFVNERIVRTIDAPFAAGDTLTVVCALSGG